MTPAANFRGMKTLLLLILGFSTSTSARAATPCPAPWACEAVEVPIRRQQSVRLRAGYLDPAPGVAFRGNVLYLEGLADSMLNHQPLFSRLTAEGYRVIAFDYPGQGGSEGSMNDTRIAWIPAMGEVIWAKFACDAKAHPRRTLIGWSTGGLAAYMAAHEGRADRVILIAPGIATKPVVHITHATLTSERTAAGKRESDGAADPHVDPISPVSPLLVPAFTVDLLATAKRSHGWGIAAGIPGLVLLSGNADAYVPAGRVRRVLAERAPHFKVVQFPGALHEIDNEIAPIREGAISQIVRFLNETR